MRGRIHRGGEAWDDLGGAWAALGADPTAAPADGDPFTRLTAWARSAWEVEPPGHARWFVLDDQDGPLAVLHLGVERRTVAGLPVRVLSNGTADGLVAARCRPEDLRRELWRACARAGERVDVLSLHGIRAGSAFHRLAGDRPGDLAPERNFGGYSTIATAKAYDEWLAQAGRNLAAGLRKAGNRLARHGEVRAEVATTASDVATGFQAYVDLEAAGWKGREGGGLANRPVEREQLRAFLAAAPDHGQVRTLWAGDRLAASQLCIVVGSTLHLLKTSYEDELAAAAPGNLLMAELLRDCCGSDRVTLVDLVTHLGWHARWHPDVHPTYRHQAFNRRSVPGLAAGGVARARSRRRP